MPFILLLFNLYVFGQDRINYTPPNSIILEELQDNSLSTLQDYLKRQFPQNQYGHLKIIHHSKINGKKRYVFRQFFDSILVLNTAMYLQLNNIGQLLMVENFYKKASNKISFIKNNPTDTTEIYYYINQSNELYIAKSTKFTNDSTTKENDFYDLLTNEPVFQIDIIKKYGPIDSVFYVTVFDPDPVTSALTNYGGNYIDNNDKSNSSLDNQLFIKQVMLKFDGSKFMPETDKLMFIDQDLPHQNFCFPQNDTIYINRSDTCFEQYNVLYHGSEFFKYLGSLGYDSLTNSPVKIDVWGMGGQDASYYNTHLNFVSFGTGNVDDAEDADVVIHELVHAIIDQQNPTQAIGYERRAIEEGICDYFAAGYSSRINQYNHEKIFNWDGHNVFWEGRVVNANKIYPIDKTGDIYEDGEIISAALWDCAMAIDFSTLDKLVIESFIMLSSGLTYIDFARLIIKQDSLWNGGVNFSNLSQCFTKRGILPPVSSVQYNGIIRPKPQIFVLGNAEIGYSFKFENYEPETMIVQDILGRIQDKVILKPDKQIVDYKNDKLKGIVIVTFLGRSRIKSIKLRF